ncbi:uncharacterized protein LOC129615128 [Condylostylus longicornis]|uniref:uncharacterized protein LOC129615128 n=1 Tax=Condylostylus longicornis TaxID=2530218 RepID=UPI00244DD01B|nr:uncharacterized protein LOC129615128 [Condylostylus longicornis]
MSKKRRCKMEIGESIVIERNISENESGNEIDIKYEEEGIQSETLMSSKENLKTKEKSKTYERCFKLSWHFDKRFTDWLLRSPSNLPFCKYCGVELKATGGTQDLKHHMKTRKHIRNSSVGKRQEFEEPDIKEIDHVDIIQDNLSECEAPYPFEENEKEVKYSTENPLNSENCRICGDYIPSEKDGFNGEKVFDITVLQKVINLEEEKKKIQLEMKLIIDALDGKTDESKKLLQPFTEMLMSDMCKLPDSVQRKLRMNIMHQVDTELSKIEVN